VQDARVQIFHIATLVDWKRAQESGTYTTSTYGRSLEQEGFIHAAHHDQVPQVRDTFYAEVTEPLVVLEIDTDLLDVPWREEAVGGEMYPHVYGPLTTSAVVAWRPARFLPIEIGSSDRETWHRGPVTPSVATWYRVALVVGAAAVPALVMAIVAQVKVDDPGFSTGNALVLWAMVAVFAVPALVALGLAEWLRSRPTDADAPADPA
jgi:uncharacterized protein (DUF952 family)